MGIHDIFNKTICVHVEAEKNDSLEQVAEELERSLTGFFRAIRSHRIKLERTGLLLDSRFSQDDLVNEYISDLEQSKEDFSLKSTKRKSSSDSFRGYNFYLTKFNLEECNKYNKNNKYLGNFNIKFDYTYSKHLRSNDDFIVNLGPPIEYPCFSLFFNPPDNIKIDHDMRSEWRRIMHSGYMGFIKRLGKSFRGTYDFSIRNINDFINRQGEYAGGIATKPDLVLSEVFIPGVNSDYNNLDMTIEKEITKKIVDPKPRKGYLF